MDLIQLYHRVLSRWQIVAFSTVICLVLATIYLVFAHKIYSSRAVLEVQQGGDKLLNSTNPGSDADVSPEVLKTVEQNFTSQSLLLRVIHTLNLQNDPDFAPPRATPYLDSELLERLQSRLSVELRRGTRLIDVVVEDRSPVLAQRIARGVISQYLEQSFEDQLDSMKNSNDYLSNEVQRFWSDLPTIRKALDKNDSTGLLDVASVAQDAQVADLETRIHLEEANFASLKEVFMENHPRYQAEQRRLQELRDEQNAALLSAAQRIDNSHENAQATESEFTNRLKQQEQQIASSGGLASYDILAQNVESDRALYDAVLARMRQTTGGTETGLTPAPVESSVQVVEEPLVAAKPVKPRRVLILMAALLAGVVIGVGYIHGEEYVRSAFTSVFDVESSLGIPVLAAVPKSRAFAGSGSVAANPNSVETEAFRTLRAAIHLHEKRDDAGPAAKDLVRNAVLFTSANPGEGKTSCAYNYAVMLARQGQRTLLIDGDLRRGTLTSRLLEVRNVTGLADVLTGHALPQEAWQPMRQDKLFLLPAGRTNADTAETLDSDKLGSLLHEFSSRFDHIVIDTPPINAVSDSLLLAPHVLMNCLVIQTGTTQKRAVAHACDELKKVNRGLIGAVLNQVGTDSRAAYECYGYARNVSYAYGYSA